VAVTYRSEPPADTGAHNLTCVRCDVTDPESVASALAETTERLGAPEILVCNAGITRDGLVLRMSEEDFGAVIDANLTGGFRVAKQAVRAMVRGRWGRIVFISSVSGIGGQPGQANYSASKAGLIGLARSLAKEFASRNVTVNVIAPGAVGTDMLAALNEDQLDAIVSRVPLGRVGEADEIAAAVEFLASEDASYVTGIVLAVDGGLSMG
jgi:3-oxoacyl-[acyl-carrier protein] reductase